MDHLKAEVLDQYYMGGMLIPLSILLVESDASDPVIRRFEIQNTKFLSYRFCCTK